MVFLRVFDSEVEQTVGVFRSVLVDQRIEGEASEFEDRQQACKIEAMTALGKGQCYVDEIADDIGHGNALPLGKGLDPLVLRGTDAEAGLDETRHAASFRTSAWLGYRAPFLPQADSRRKVGAWPAPNKS
jgi:hypothetical protein